MFNDIVIGPITIHMYGVMIAAGFLAALLMTLRRGKKRGYDEDIIWGIFFCAIIGGMLGTRILYYIVEIPEIMKDPSILWDFKNGYVVYGGIIGGILASYIYCRTKKQAFMPYFDLVMPAVSFAQAFGRFGCFFAGCCYGRETDAWYGITFHNSSFAPNGVKLIPTQLISSARCCYGLHRRDRRPDALRRLILCCTESEDSPWSFCATITEAVWVCCPRRS